MATRAILGAGLATAAVGQLAGPYSQEWHIPMDIQHCTKARGCTSEHAEVVMDMQWRWIHTKEPNKYSNCLPGEFWDAALCPDPETCGRNCAVEGVDQAGYTKQGAWPIEKGIKLEFPKAPRTYLMESEDRYKMFKLKNREFTFDLDLSTLPCGMNAALYFIEMKQDGDKNSLNQAGAKYGTGYCDAQCPAMNWIQGKANLHDWEKVRCAENPDGETKCGGHAGRIGYCCPEMDILEANREAGVFTAHPCTSVGPQACEGADQCGDRGQRTTGYCDKDGCGFSDFRMGNKKFWCPGSNCTVDTSRKMTVVTQFLTSDGTDAGDLVEVKRFYLQDGRVIENSHTALLPGGDNSITDAMCDAQNHLFETPPAHSFKDAGKLKAMGEALERGMVLSMSIWDDGFGRMLWLDGEKSRFDQDMSKPGITRGPCPFKYGTHEDMLDQAKREGPMSVEFTDIRYGALGSTYRLV